MPLNQTLAFGGEELIYSILENNTTHAINLINKVNARQHALMNLLDERDTEKRQSLLEDFLNGSDIDEMRNMLLTLLKNPVSKSLFDNTEVSDLFNHLKINAEKQGIYQFVEAYNKDDLKKSLTSLLSVKGLRKFVFASSYLNSLNGSSHEITPLITAINKGNDAVSNALIDSKLCDLNYYSDNIQTTALMLAIESNNTHIAIKLIHELRAHFGASAFNRTFHDSLNKNSTMVRVIEIRELARAVQKGNIKLVQALIDAGCGLNEASRSLGGPTTYTPLMNAMNDPKISDLFLKNEQCDLNAKNNMGETVLMIASRSNEHIGFVKTLLATYRKDPNQKCNIDHQDHMGMTALMNAATYGATETMDVLIKAGCKLDVQNAQGETALMLAVKKGDLKTVKILIKAHCNLDIQNKKGESALMIAMNAENMNIVKALVKANCNTHLQNNKGATAFMMAVKLGYIAGAAAIVNKAQLKNAETIKSSPDKLNDLLYKLQHKLLEELKKTSKHTRVHTKMTILENAIIALNKFQANENLDEFKKSKEQITLMDDTRIKGSGQHETSELVQEFSAFVNDKIQPANQRSTSVIFSKLDIDSASISATPVPREDKPAPTEKQVEQPKTASNDAQMEVDAHSFQSRKCG